MEDTQARKAAEERLQQQAGFKKMIGGFLLLIVLAVVIWALTGQGYFWPAWMILGLAVATVATAWSAYGPRQKGPSQSEIEAEARKFEDG
jgi:Flp pilus assembly protein TadB